MQVMQVQKPEKRVLNLKEEFPMSEWKTVLAVQVPEEKQAERATQQVNSQMQGLD
jgi:hypothetical protein